MTIGITLNIKEDENIWVNGILQNVINFALLLKNIPINYNIIVVNTSEKNKLDYNIKGIDIYPIDERINDIDILFILGSQISDEHYKIIKKNKTKIIFYNCGSTYIVEMENVIFDKRSNNNPIYKHQPDEVWIIPQNYKTNKYYFESIYRVESKEAPFVWSSVFLDYVNDNFDINIHYQPSKDKKRISCFEPNINVVKYAMYDILIVEKLYRERKDFIEHFYVTNTTENMKKSKLFNSIVNEFDIYKDGIMSFETRYRMPYFLSEYTDIVISHQWENPLNYAYLDALYLNYPLVHNANMIKESGYYYDEFNVDKGKEQLLKALTNHDNNIEEYNERSKKTLERFVPTNEKSIDTYDKMIKKLITK